MIRPPFKKFSKGSVPSELATNLFKILLFVQYLCFCFFHVVLLSSRFTLETIRLSKKVLLLTPHQSVHSFTSAKTVSL